jgi:hypothetical protein
MSTIDRRSVFRLGGIATGLVVATAGTRQLAVAAPPDPPDDAERFDEQYRNRRIRGAGSRRRDRHTPREVITVSVDGAELHVMSNPDGSYTSVMNHYQSFPTLRRTTHAAVDSLHGASLRPIRHG